MEIVIYIYNGLTALDTVGPYEVLSRLPNAKVKFVAKEKGVIVTDTHFLKLVAEYDISEITTADILLIPGSTVGFLKEIKNKTVISWIQKIHETTTWTTSVCSGSIILGAAGILKGLPATTHWAVSHLLKDYEAIPTSERFIQNGKIITAAGVSAGIDMSLFLVGQILGEEKAKGYQLVLEYDPQPPFDGGNFQKADERSIKIARKIMENDAKKDLTLLEMVRYAQSLIKLKKKKKSMNNLARTVNKVKNYPKWVLSFLIGRTVRFVGTAGISFEEMTTERVIASIENKPKNRNHIGQVHAAAMVLLAETATGMVVGMNIDDNKIPLIKSIKTNFVRRSSGSMRAVATITEEQKAMMKNQEKGEILIAVSVTDESGQAPIECEMLWAWITKK